MTATDASLAVRLDGLLASAPEALADPFPLYRDLRAAGRVVEHGTLVFVSHHEDVKEVIRDGARFSNHAAAAGSHALALRERLAPEQRSAFDEVTAFEARSLSRLDGAEHARVRAIAHRAFTPRRIAAMQGTVEVYTDELLQPLVDGETLDLMDLAYRLPLWVVCDILGIPPPDRDVVHGWSLRVARNRGGAEVEPLLDARTAHRELRAYVGAVVEEHRRSPESCSDFVRALLDAAATDRLTADELTAMFVLLIVAGHETTTNLVGIGMLELLRRPDEWRVLTGDPSLVEDAVEELLRFVTPAHWLPRFAVGAVQLGGVRVAAGATVVPLLAAANRDAGVFEDPERLDLRRRDSRKHLALGYGAHFCLGASLARLEAQVAFATLARRFPRLALATDHVEWTGHAVLRRLARLPVALDTPA